MLKMRMRLKDSDRKWAERTRDFVSKSVEPHASDWDRRGELPDTILRTLTEAGLVATILGHGSDRSAGYVRYGAMMEEIGRSCSSVRSLLTVHDMVCAVLHRWGGAETKDDILPTLLDGHALAAFALSEPDAGSDAGSITTIATLSEGGYRIRGRKTWITLGAAARWLLVFAREGTGISTFLVDGSDETVKRRRIHECVGTRAATPAEIDFENTFVPSGRRVGPSGSGFPLIATSALTIGRIGVAFGAVGIAETALRIMRGHAATRIQFGEPLIKKQIVRQIITRSMERIQSARLLCFRAADLLDIGHLDAEAETMLAKYSAAKAATAVVADSIQVLGARGLMSTLPLERLSRDARVSEIIEGSTQVIENALPELLDIDLVESH